MAPRTPVEAGLAGIYASVLKVERVGVHDDFFALGGHSLLATQLVSRIRDTFKVELPLRHIFESPTVATLAEQIEIAQRTVGGTPPPPLVPAPRDGEIPLSFAQQRLWFLDQFEPNSPFYNIPEAVRLHGPVDPAVLERCLNEIVRRHEALRTTFKTVDGKPQQVIAPELYVPFPVVDLTSLPKAAREVEARRLAEREAQRPFDLAHGPLLRARLVRLDEDDHVVLLTIHHIIGDDWSTQVLVQEMALLYDAFAHNRPSPLPELPIQYADYAHWQRNWLQGEALEAQLDYWRKQLEGAPPLLELPTVRPRPAVPTYRGDYVTFQLSPELTDGIRTLAQREGATLFMTLLAAFKTLLYRYSGQTDICIGTPVAGRNRAELENLIGFFINTLVLRSDLSGEPSFRDLLKQVRETALSAYAHQDVPFEMLIDALDLEREMSHTPLFQVMFALQNAPVKVRQVSDLTLSSFEAHSGTSKFDMTLFAVEHEDRISGALEFSTELWDRSTIERLLRHFETLLEAIVRDPAEPISRLPLLTEAERHTLLVEWNSRTLDYPADECLHHAFERRAAETPDAEAVVYEGRSLTFRELNERANKLAHALRKRGVGPETLVGLAMDRSPEMIVGLLGILKAGGAYVPLDPSYPLDRLSYMLENAAAPALVTTAEHVASLPAEGRTVLRLDADWPEIEQESAENPDSGVTASNLAYVIYTSGSTGQPKGVMVEHRSVQNLAAALDHLVYRHLPQRRLRISLNAPLSFDASMQQLCMMLTRGHTLVIIPQAARLDGEALLRTIRE
ncbi:MAG: AMP-binding protein [Chloroflexi bacterium]|nr:AMP-binding protein [Chloroflexota bacterium]